jgi:hypothetical protein
MHKSTNYYEDFDDGQSTDLLFGVDPRFTEQIDEDLRATRLISWITGHLNNASKEARGSLCEVEQIVMKINAKGIDPWYFRDIPLEKR